MRGDGAAGLRGLRDNLEREELQNGAGVECGGGEGEGRRGALQTVEGAGQSPVHLPSVCPPPWGPATRMQMPARWCWAAHVPVGWGRDGGQRVSLSPRAFLSSEPQKLRASCAPSGFGALKALRQAQDSGLWAAPIVFQPGRGSPHSLLVRELWRGAAGEGRQGTHALL